MNTAKCQIRLIVVPPFQGKTAQFVAAMQRQKDVGVEIVETRPLPHYQYDYSTYDPIDYTFDLERKIFEAHQSFYLPQVIKANQAKQFPLLVSGRFHENSGVFCSVLGGISGNGFDFYIVSFDQHYDCIGSLFVAGGFWRFLIGERNKRNNRHFDPTKFYFSGIHHLNINDKTYKAAKAALANNPAAVDNPLSKDLAPVIVETMKQHDADNGLLAESRLLRTVSLCQRVAEEIWVEQNGLNVAESATDLPAQGGIFLSLDGDVSYKGGRIFSVDDLSPFFSQMAGANIFALHVAELDSPDCHFNPCHLAQFLSEQIQQQKIKPQ